MCNLLEDFLKACIRGLESHADSSQNSCIEMEIHGSNSCCCKVFKLWKKRWIECSAFFRLRETEDV